MELTAQLLAVQVGVEVRLSQGGLGYLDDVERLNLVGSGCSCNKLASGSMRLSWKYRTQADI